MTMKSASEQSDLVEAKNGLRLAAEPLQAVDGGVAQLLIVANQKLDAKVDGLDKSVEALNGKCQDLEVRLADVSPQRNSRIESLQGIVKLMCNNLEDLSRRLSLQTQDWDRMSEKSQENLASMFDELKNHSSIGQRNSGYMFKELEHRLDALERRLDDSQKSSEGKSDDSEGKSFNIEDVKRQLDAFEAAFS